MSNRMKVAVLLAAVGIAAPAMAQDSVSAQTGLANTDALNAWSASDQLKPYVVDLQTITTSWGTNFGLAPIIKASRSEATFTNSLFSGQSLSNMTLTGPAPYASYSRWSNPGFGVFPNPAINAPGKPISVSGDTIQLATTFSEFGTTVGPGYNGLIGGLINYKASDSTRLYVARMGMAVNGANNTESTAQFGTGAVDASGNAYFRADDNGAGTTGEIVLQNLMRVRMRTLGAGLLGRTTSMLNVINNNIDTGATLADNNALDWVLKRNSVTQNCPNAIPFERGLGVTRGVMLDTNFGTNYVYESSVNTLSSSIAHRPAPWVDQRGNTAFTRYTLFPGSVGTCGSVLKNTTVNPDVAQGVGIWGVDTNGAIVGTQQITLPASVTDTGVTPSYTINFDNTYNPADTSDLVDGFEGHRGTNAFRGGPQVALGQDQAGNMIVSALVFKDRSVGTYNAGSNTSKNWPYQVLTAARIASPGATPQWQSVAWVVPDASTPTGTKGKAFEDGNGVALGELRPFIELGVAGAFGPSISCSAIDSVGNVWFIAAYDRYDEFGNLRNNPNTGIFRGVYNAAANNYRLELVMPTGIVVHGVNSNRDYKVIFLSMVDSGSAPGGNSSSSIFSNNINQGTWANANRASLQTRDARTMGGMVFYTSLIYDVNNDGEFTSLTGAQGDPNSPDQNYNALMFLSGTVPAVVGPDCFNKSAPTQGGFYVAAGADGIADSTQCVGDWDRNNIVEPADIAQFIQSWSFAVANPGTPGIALYADLDCNGVVEPSDIAVFIQNWLGGTTPGNLGCP